MIEYKKHYKILAATFAVILVWGIFFKMNDVEEIIVWVEKTMEYDLYKISNFHDFLHDYDNVLTNVLAFIPFGFFVAAGAKEQSLKKAITRSFLMSLSLEIAQLFVVFASLSVADVVTNTLGGLIGGLVYYMIYAAGSLLKIRWRENIQNAFIIVAYTLLIPYAISGILGVIQNIDFYIDIQLQWMRAVYESLR